ncbi:MAG: aminoacyl-tRNA hydrolase [Candidatus Staskawiczbacteria bacterium RIFOXYD2_FULL_37_9]|uniref:Peptidyl-tRNA hydrolase n=1 Tax=Candidatus Staskawiczbacteria bacterium RIFOXYB1_FULL_37_44 TaxID=1802223 RepID=A0A1G2IVX2_9BACT|nr:MAG: aminoacyl-tRNA hydrolase [Candidatus Staskawiczbacteria bacterium RIFOXYB1_FULL_37_44]OGZ83996.1 MAG: aminoacyl-tRNA hydrolase [Candidatus Staskawiczbacteria bacterium RIFOXYC1_FULL_37_52]OGZ89566.1 MAG: aminoacyl-tRNA hydrolase [Candidatus Staskawiczbacteria bacterium RIFOXYD1_FULL_37_110]OGZ92916.1 MAG: aminoacyl-tRNA hydrolase [Candidatus Staskawiczbacteria bacterium RIFOXYD2_FULL_37_9]
MTIIIGLGNPGEKYKNTRHNIGFMILDKFAEKNNFPEFKLVKKYTAEISEKPFDSAQGDENIILAKPQTFMNESGKSAKKLISNFKFQISNFIVVHDDIDLPVGKIKIIQERGSAGHKGVESIIKAIGNENLIRLRIGISPCLTPGVKQAKASNIVLKKFSPEEQEILNQTTEKTAEALDFLLREGLDKAMNEYN